MEPAESSAAALRTGSASLLHSSEDLDVPARTAFELLAQIEKWPVWLSLLRSARRADESVPLGLGSEIVLRSSIPGDVEQVYEIDGFLAGHIISLVGAYSIRRRIDLRVESKSTHSRLVVRLDYPAYGGPVGQFIDRMTARRRLATQLDASLVHFKGLVEYAAREGEALDDL